MAVIGTHDPYLVALSFAVACLASYAALDLGSRVRVSGRWARLAWLATAAIAMGGGIWSMHFIAMLAFFMPMPVSFDFGLTLLSLVVAIGVTGFGFFTIGTRQATAFQFVLSGIFMGIGIAAMHYTGMAAMRMPADLRYDRVLVALSVLIAIAASIAALSLAFRTTLAWQRLLAAVVMGSAISGMHYTGMAAATFIVHPGMDEARGVPSLAQTDLALSIAAITFVILLLALVASTFDKKLIRLAEREMGLVRDITQRKRAEEHLHLLMREINHRSRNMLAVVQSIAHRTVASNVEEFIDRFSERIQALSANQDLLIKNDWHGADVEELVRAQLAPFSDLIDTRIQIQGPHLRVTPSAAQSIGLALHELATNASKYGPLSNDRGCVGIDWQLDRDEFTISWVERDGPCVEPPRRKGFGTTVISVVAKASVEGKVELDYPATGLIWRLKSPASKTLEAV
jgi:NO-binding membrane sensor protein with MHYT domain/two-component sensor histidine kinase